MRDTLLGTKFAFHIWLNHSSPHVCVQQQNFSLMGYHTRFLCAIWLLQSKWVAWRDDAGCDDDGDRGQGQCGGVRIRWNETRLRGHRVVYAMPVFDAIPFSSPSPYLYIKIKWKTKWIQRTLHRQTYRNRLLILSWLDDRHFSHILYVLCVCVCVPVYVCMRVVLSLMWQLVLRWFNQTCVSGGWNPSYHTFCQRNEEQGKCSHCNRISYPIGSCFVVAASEFWWIHLVGFSRYLYWILFDIIESFFYSFMTSFTSYFIPLRLLFEYMKLSLALEDGLKRPGGWARRGSIDESWG